MHRIITHWNSILFCLFAIDDNGKLISHHGPCTYNGPTGWISNIWLGDEGEQSGWQNIQLSAISTKTQNVFFSAVARLAFGIISSWHHFIEMTSQTRFTCANAIWLRYFCYFFLIRLFNFIRIICIYFRCFCQVHCHIILFSFSQHPVEYPVPGILFSIASMRVRDCAP